MAASLKLVDFYLDRFKYYEIDEMPSSMERIRQDDQVSTDSNETTPELVVDNQKLLESGVVRCPINDRIDIQKWASELSQVTPLNMTMEGDSEYAFYRNILDEPHFPFDAVLFKGSDPGCPSCDSPSEIGKALQKYFGISNLKYEIMLDDAFCVHYNMDQSDTTGAKHTDPR